MATHRKIADFALLRTNDPETWEKAYRDTIEEKYQKGTRGYSKKFVGTSIPEGEEVPIFLIPRERGGPSYKEQSIAGFAPDDLQYCAISKGFGMQDLSSFSLGPIIGPEGGLCLVNYSHSKQICLHHLEGGGVVDLKRKGYWRRSRHPLRTIELCANSKLKGCQKATKLSWNGTSKRPRIKVDGVEHDALLWMEEHKDLWFPEWEKWRNSVALCSNGNFHWAEESPTICYYNLGRYLDFVEWKKECYIRPSMERLPALETYQFLVKVWKEQRMPLGLVHPMACGEGILEPITKEQLTKMFDSETEMCCQPYVVAATLFGMIV